MRTADRIETSGTAIAYSCKFGNDSKWDGCAWKLGLIAKEHSSSGRIPSERGYRYYVDHIMKPAKIDRGAVQNIRQSFGNEFQKVDEIIATSARILSDLTQYTAISLKPESADIRLEGFRMVPIGDRQVMVILVTSDGTVESQMYNLPAGINGDELESVIRVINDKVVGLSLNQVVAKLHECLPSLRSICISLTDSWMRLAASLTKRSKSRYT